MKENTEKFNVECDMRGFTILHDLKRLVWSLSVDIFHNISVTNRLERFEWRRRKDQTLNEVGAESLFVMRQI